LEESERDESPIAHHRGMIIVMFNKLKEELKETMPENSMNIREYGQKPQEETETNE
jgi:hypothetical protein